MSVVTVETTSGRTVYVEVDESKGFADSDSSDTNPIKRKGGVGNQSPKELREKILDQIEGIAELVDGIADRMASKSPTEITIETTIKFGGKVNVVPFIAASSAEGGLKVALKWSS